MTRGIGTRDEVCIESSCIVHLVERNRRKVGVNIETGLVQDTHFSVKTSPLTTGIYIGAGVPRAGVGDKILLLFSPLKIRTLAEHDPDPPERDLPIFLRTMFGRGSRF